MDRVVIAVLSLVLLAAPEEPAQTLRRLVSECRAESGSFRNAASDAERKAAVERSAAYALRFAELAESHPAEEIALEAALESIREMNGADSLTQVTWEMNRTNFPEKSPVDPSGRVAALLLRHHARSEKLGPLCLRMSYGIRREYETLLREVERASPHRDVRAIACLALAQFLNGRALKLDLASARPEIASRFENLFGREYFDELRRRGRAEARRDVESFFDRAVAEYGDVAHPYGGTIGDKARSELFEIRNLAIGKTAPEIDGVDQDGRRLTLGDHRGRVVLLDFWQEA